jgi:putative sterol carrier protein
MSGRRSTPWTEFSRQFEDIPVLSDFARPFPNLLREKDSALAESFKQVASALSKSKRSGTIQFTIDDGGKVRHWSLGMSAAGCEAMETAVERPSLEIITDARTWTEIATGRIAPLEAFGQGKVRVRGDIELALLLARRVQRQEA